MADKHRDLYQEVTTKILAALEKGTPPWHKPWAAGGVGGFFPVRHNGQPYNGVNVMLLWIAQDTNGYTNNRWMTFKQAVEYGGMVRKGEHGEMVVYLGRSTKTEVNPKTNEDEVKTFSFLKFSTVFNVEQIDGLPERFYGKPAINNPLNERIEAVEGFVGNTKAEIQHGGNQAFYVPSKDFIKVPEIKTFEDTESYYATVLHELTHWTQHKSRLNREFGRARWGDEGYAAEELVAELGAAFLCAQLEISLTPRPDHAAYLANWAKVLRDDKKAIFTAASHATKACEFLNKLQPQSETATETETEEAAQ